jgi:hypothetical protein
MMSILPIIFCWLLASRQVAAMQRPQVPKETGTETFSEPKRITGSFNGGFKKYGRGVSCGGGEGGESRAVFIVEDGGTIEVCLPFTLHLAGHLPKHLHTVLLYKVIFSSTDKPCDRMLSLAQISLKESTVEAPAPLRMCGG